MVIFMEPLAVKLRPQCLKDVIGQKHLVGDGEVLYNLVKNKKIFSMILYGKPGCGKTTIANAICLELGLRYRSLNAVVNTKKDFDVVIEEAKMYNGLIVVMDEIHRLNKDKQDLMLPYLENGLITLIGMTTSNPYHKINPAIRSRCQIFTLNELDFDDIVLAINKAVNSNFLQNIKISDDAITYIAKCSAGDIRFAYNLLELAYYSTYDFNITIDVLKKINNKPVSFYDSNDDGHYDIISAFQKSIRGSDVNASLYYLACLIEAGDLDIIYRRMSVIAYEDIGLANPNMGMRVDACINACERLGLPEARIPLSVMVVDLALSPKSNSAHIGLDIALSDLEKGYVYSVPDNIKTNALDYKYPHDYPNSWVNQEYLPSKLKNRKYYIPKNNKYENDLERVMMKIEKNKKNV